MNTPTPPASTALPEWDAANPGPHASLSALRAAIDVVDDQILAAIARRFALTQAVRQEKERAGQPVLDPAREANLVSRATRRARALGLPEDEIRALYWRLLAASRKSQREGQMALGCTEEA